MSTVNLKDLIPTVLHGALSVNNLLHVEDRKAAGTSSGTFTTGAWRTRDLNTVVTNTIAGASLGTGGTANQVMLPAGEYWVEGSASAWYVENYRHRLNIDNGDQFILSCCAYAGQTNSGDRSLISGIFSIGLESSIILEGYCFRTQTDNGFGSNDNITTGIFSVLKIWKVG